MWVAYTEDGLITPIWGYNAYCWKNKREALKELMACKLEPRKHPKIYRVCSGKYEYIPGDCDNYGLDDDAITIERLTKQNISKLEEWLELDEFD